MVCLRTITMDIILESASTVITQSKMAKCQMYASKRISFLSSIEIILVIMQQQPWGPSRWSQSMILGFPYPSLRIQTVVMSLTTIWLDKRVQRRRNLWLQPRCEEVDNKLPPLPWPHSPYLSLNHKSEAGSTLSRRILILNWRGRCRLCHHPLALEFVISIETPWINNTVAPHQKIS